MYILVFPIDNLDKPGSRSTQKVKCSTQQEVDSS